MSTHVRSSISQTIVLTLKVSEKLSLLKSSAANNCLTLLTNLSKEANRVDPDQTAPIGAV